MTQKIEIEDVKRLNVQPGDRVVFTVDIGNMPPNRAAQYIQKLKENLKGFVPDGVETLIKTNKVQMEVVSRNVPLSEVNW